MRSIDCPASGYPKLAIIHSAAISGDENLNSIPRPAYVGLSLHLFFAHTINFLMRVNSAERTLLITAALLVIACSLALPSGVETAALMRLRIAHDLHSLLGLCSTSCIRSE